MSFFIILTIPPLDRIQIVAMQLILALLPGEKNGFEIRLFICTETKKVIVLNKSLLVTDKPQLSPPRYISPCDRCRDQPITGFSLSKYKNQLHLVCDANADLSLSQHLSIVKC